MTFMVSFQVKDPQRNPQAELSDDQIKEWIQTNLEQMPTPEENPLEFCVFENKIENLKIIRAEPDWWQCPHCNGIMTRVEAGFCQWCGKKRL